MSDPDEPATGSEAADEAVADLSASANPSPVPDAAAGTTAATGSTAPSDAAAPGADASDAAPDKEALTRRRFLRMAGNTVIGVGAVSIAAQVYSSLRFLLPEKEFLSEWRGTYPVLLEDGTLELEGRPIVAEQLEAAAPPGGRDGLVFLWDDDYWDQKSSGIIVNDTEEGYVAFSQVCTHEKCVARWVPQARDIEGKRYDRSIYCACHDAYFQKDGGLLSGAPEDPLPFFDVDIDGDGIVRLARREG